MPINSLVLFLSHGGGPMPLLGDSNHLEMVDCLKKITQKIPKPAAIIVISAHWEESVATITSGSNPSLIYDYSGFPEETYHYKYDCGGEPKLAEKIHNALKNTGITSRLDAQRGFDHGMFVPLKIMFPQADIPCVQLSLVNTLDPQQHIDIGKALNDLDYENLLIIGSGFSFHNMREFFAPSTEQSKNNNEAFQQWLVDTCGSKSMTENEREKRLVEWKSSPSALFCHPREEHLLPLHVCYGAANSACQESFELTILNKKSSMYLWSN